jgi:hypothetical protein
MTKPPCRGLGCTLAAPRLERKCRRAAVVKEFFRENRPLSRSCSAGPAHHGDMADFLAVLFIIVFTVAMLGLIWALDKV